MIGCDNNDAALGCFVQMPSQEIPSWPSVTVHITSGGMVKPGF